MIKFRNLNADEVEVRVGGGGSLLLYKTARVDANILDETVGAENWQKRFYQVKNTMICSIGINVNYDKGNAEPLWVWKDDGGDDDYTMEKVKAECSDSMKRAGFQWGIGRSLYTAPKIKLPEQYKNSQFFDVSELEYDQNNRISKLTITTNFGKDIVYQFANGRKQAVNPVAKNNDSVDENAPIRDEEKKWLQNYLQNSDPTKYEQFFNWLERYFKTRNIGELTASQGIIVVNRLRGK